MKIVWEVVAGAFGFLALVGVMWAILVIMATNI
jgi:hypothetical protein